MSSERNNTIFKSFIGPWVLPNEEIPVHIIWDKDFDFNVIKIEKPEDLILSEFVNIEDYCQEQNLYIIRRESIKKHDGIKDYPCFFGIIFIYKNLNFDELKLFKNIKVRFCKDTEIVYELPFLARIFRPKLNNLSTINPIVLEDRKNDYKIDLNFECKGFGFVSTSIEAEINRIKFTFDDSLFKRAYKKLKRKYKNILNNNYGDIQPEIRERFISRINPELVTKFLNIIDIFVNKENKENGDIIKAFEDENIDAFLIMNFIVEVIEELKIRYKNENVLLNTPVLKLPKESFNDFIHKILLFIHYEDLNGNKYDPLVLELNVNDVRSHPQDTKINFVINVDKIEDRSYKDIESIE